MNGQFHHIEINVSDLTKSTQFWTWLLTKKFSYSIFQTWNKGISFQLEGMYLVFVQTDEKHIDTKYNRKNTGLNHIAFHCDSREFVDALTKELKEKNITILYPDKHPFAGGKDHYAVYFEDPDRIKVEVIVSRQ